MERFLKHVMPEPNSGCWLWTGALKANGYGNFCSGTEQYAHRTAYALFKGPIPKGLTIDHLCRVRSCVNPDHLEAVTLRENVRRGGNRHKTHCPHGHAYDETNTRVRKAGDRRCRKCESICNHKQWLRRRSIALATPTEGDRE